MAPKGSSAVRRLFAAAFQVRTYSAPADRSIPAAKQKYIPASGTYPKGFLAASAFAGVKASNTQYDDVALVVSEEPCPAAGVFTRNLFKAAPVLLSAKTLTDRDGHGFRGVVVNSGCANAVTGNLGLEHAEHMARTTDQCFDTPDSADAPPRTLVMSTGVIGQRLPIDRITDAIPKLHQSLGSSHDHWMKAARAICTTDTFPKLISRTFTLPSHPETTYSIAGMTKGAGMIHPNMGTLLAIVCTDAKVDPSSMAPFLRLATDISFNCISIDGDTSTNDTVNFFANGAAAPSDASPLRFRKDKASRASATAEEQADTRAFIGVLRNFFIDLSHLVVRDGEGATKFVTIRVRSDLNYEAARRAAVSIARSALVKTALYGKDANWGRILCAIGYAPGIMNSRELPTKHLLPKNPQNGRPIVPVKPYRTSVSFIPADGSEELKLLVRGEPEAVDEGRAKQILEAEDLEILVRLEDDGDAAAPNSKKIREAVFWTCDLSHEYVTINGDYRT